MNSRCEDFPCCGHELGDCDGSLYGSDESIMEDPHLLCDHNSGYCEVCDREADDDYDYDYEEEAAKEAAEINEEIMTMIYRDASHLYNSLYAVY